MSVVQKTSPWLIAVLFSCVFISGDRPVNAADPDALRGPIVVLGYNDLGMHCMNQDFSQMMILPPFNTLHAQVIFRASSPPRILTSDVTVTYALPGNTHSADKTNFWQYAHDLLDGLFAFPPGFGPDIGLTGHTLAGTMSPTVDGNGAPLGDWSVTGIPLTPITDTGAMNPLQLASIRVTAGNYELARTRAVVPVSWELSCALCHDDSPTDAPANFLIAHDDPRLGNGTHLYDKWLQDGKPVLCGRCHAQPELGLPGQPGVESLSLAIHKAHSTRMDDVISGGMVPNGIGCYGCHPGPTVRCLRDVHAAKGMTCMDCHAQGRDPGDSQACMLAVGDAGRAPWSSEPRCGDCHPRKGNEKRHEYEQPGTLFRNSKGHGGVFCEACHSSTHAINPAMTAPDNVQAILQQNYAGPIKTCTVCHLSKPKGPFEHRYFVSRR